MNAPSDDAGLRALFEGQHGRFSRRVPGYERRMDALTVLRNGLRARETDLAAAISADFGGRAIEETLLLELLPLYDQIGHARRNLRSWMKPRRVGSTWFLLPSRASIVSQPLGVVGVIGAWNYPLLLSIGPLIDALAAGNHVMLKPSELAPRSATLIAQMIGAAFEPEYVTCVTGGIQTAAAFSSLPFDHLFFTGSARVGRLVMCTASAHLTPVTLELGGKCPVILHDTFPLELAVRRILTGKLYNSGQTCVAPDYLLVPVDRREELVSIAVRVAAELYPSLVRNPDYTRIINVGQYGRLVSVLEDATSHGARTVEINPASEDCSSDNRVFPPTLVIDPPLDGRLMREEIFGPILPIVPYHSIDEAIEFVNARPHPLALYYFDTDAARIDRVVQHTRSGGVGVNDVVLHLGQHNLPFGGVGPSGMGHYHGVHGFRTFSQEKGVMIQSRWAPTRLLRPPYSPRTRSMIDRLLRFSLR